MLKRKLINSWPNVRKYLLVLCLIFFVFIFIKAGQLASKNKLTPVVFWQLITNRSDALKQIEGKTNILLLGIGGKNHDGADMTDTIILLSINWLKNDMVMISIPRDIWIQGFKDKINAAYDIGEKKQSGGGFVLAKAAVEEVTGAPIQYAGIIDFTGFKEIINLIDGIDVNIEDAFTDNEYPISGRENDDCGGDPKYLCRYESITFNQGIEHMDGDRALKYVRSRHATDENGTDFSRAQRQQVVIAAIKNKIISQKIFLNPGKLSEFIKIAQKNVKTDLAYGEILLLGKKVAFDKQTLRSFILPWDQPDKKIQGLLINPPLWQYENLWVLIPKSGDYEKIHEYVLCIVENKNNCEEIYKTIN